MVSRSVRWLSWNAVIGRKGAERAKYERESTLDCDRIATFAREYVAMSPLNLISEDWALDTGLAGLKMYDEPVFGFAAAQDELLLGLPHIKEANLPMMMTPDMWLEGAKTVISFLLPKSAQVRRSNIGGSDPSLAWLHARIEGQFLIKALCQEIAALLQQGGYKAVIPSYDPRFKSTGLRYVEELGGSFTSKWSERHAAYACGLGTFCLSKGVITEKGVAVRFGSIITDLALTPTPPPGGQGIYDNCTLCGACVQRCPAGAITLEGGKDHSKCAVYVDEMKKKYSPRYACGKCQVGVPCEGRIPARQ